MTKLKIVTLILMFAAPVVLGVTAFAAGEEFDENHFNKSDFGSDGWEFFKKFCMDERETLKNCLSNTKK